MLRLKSDASEVVYAGDHGGWEKMGMEIRQNRKGQMSLQRKKHQYLPKDALKEFKNYVFFASHTF